MSKVYRAVPVDEEQSRSSSDTVYEKEAVAVRFRDEKFERDVRTRTLDFLGKNWAWIAHTVLLSMSLILFTLSFCQRTARVSDLQVTQQYSSYCMSAKIARRPPPEATHTGLRANTHVAPVAPIVKYDTVRFNLTPMVEGPFVGYGPEVDKAWDSIANDSMHMPSQSSHSSQHRQTLTSSS